MTNRSRLTAVAVCFTSSLLASTLAVAACTAPSGPGHGPSPTQTPTRTPASDPASPEGTWAHGGACENAWHDARFAVFAPGFPLRLPVGSDLQQVLEGCPGEPARERQVALYREAFATTALLLEQRLHQETLATGKRPCEIIDDVLHPVVVTTTRNGRIEHNVEGYRRDGFLPITYRQWTGGPYRLKYAVGCEPNNHASLWLLAEQGWYAETGQSEHERRYPDDSDALDMTWEFPDLGHQQSACVTYSTALGNDVPSGRGRVLVFEQPNHLSPEVFFTCHELVNGDPQYVDYPTDELAPLP